MVFIGHFGYIKVVFIGQCGYIKTVIIGQCGGFLNGFHWSLCGWIKVVFIGHMTVAVIKCFLVFLCDPPQRIYNNARMGNRL